MGNVIDDSLVSIFLYNIIACILIFSVGNKLAALINTRCYDPLVTDDALLRTDVMTGDYFHKIDIK